MSFVEIFLIGVGLSMDAFAISICKGLSLKEYKIKYSVISGAYFGIAQAVMPLIGFLLGTQFREIIKAFDHWTAFILLTIIGANMIRESFSKEEDSNNNKFDFKTMFLLAIATSIDALVVGVTFAFLTVNIIPAIIIIGCTTFAFSAVGVRIGKVFGAWLKSKAELTGGVILILMGLKILIEHLVLKR